MDERNGEVPMQKNRRNWKYTALLMLVPLACLVSLSSA